MDPELEDDNADEETTFVVIRYQDGKRYFLSNIFANRIGRKSNVLTWATKFKNAHVFQGMTHHSMMRWIANYTPNCAASRAKFYEGND